MTSLRSPAVTGFKGLCYYPFHSGNQTFVDSGALACHCRVKGMPNHRKSVAFNVKNFILQIKAALYSFSTLKLQF